MNSHIPIPPEKITLNKLIAPKDTCFGSRLWHRGVYYVVVDEGGSGVAEHWIMKIDENQDHVPPPK